MLVCHVVVRPLGRTIAADLAEIATADDASTTGQAIFATLIDDPTSSIDTVDAYIGEIMVEAALAADTVDVGLVYVADVLEEATAISAESGAVPTTYEVSIDEPTSASSSQDATTGAPSVQYARILSGSNAVFGSTVLFDDGGGKTQVVSNVGAVT